MDDLFGIDTYFEKDHRHGKISLWDLDTAYDGYIPLIDRLVERRLVQSARSDTLLQRIYDLVHRHLLPFSDPFFRQLTQGQYSRNDLSSVVAGACTFAILLCNIDRPTASTGAPPIVFEFSGATGSDTSRGDIAAVGIDRDLGKRI